MNGYIVLKKDGRFSCVIAVAKETTMRVYASEAYCEDRYVVKEEGRLIAKRDMRDLYHKLSGSAKSGYYVDRDSIILIPFDGGITDALLARANAIRDAWIAAKAEHDGAVAAAGAAFTEASRVLNRAKRDQAVAALKAAGVAAGIEL